MEKTNKELWEQSLNLVKNNIFIYLTIIVALAVAIISGRTISHSNPEYIIAVIGITAVSAIVFYILSLLVSFICLYIPKAVTINGVIHRLEYFAILIFSAVMYKTCLLLYAPEDLKLNYTPTTLMFSMGAILTLFVLYIEICATIKRLKDLNWSKWLVILTLIPYVCILIRIPCLFFKGKINTSDQDSNEETV